MELTFGEMLLIGLKRQGLTYQDVADAIGVTKQSISLYVTGEGVPDSVTTVKRLSEVMQLDVNDTTDLLGKYKAFCTARPVRSAYLRAQLMAQQKYIAELESRVKELEEKV